MTGTDEEIYQHGVSDLELSVRASNVLRLAGVTTMQDFMRLTKQRVLSFANSGARTWKEIEQVQKSLQPEALRNYRLGILESALLAVNRVLAEDPDIMVVVRGNILIGAVRVTA